MPSNMLRRAVILFNLMAIVATVLGIWYAGLWRWLFVNTSYYVLWAMLALWVYALAAHLTAARFRLPDFIRANWPYLLTGLAITVLFLRTTSVTFKTLNDEANLLSVSQSLLYFRTPEEINNGLNFWGSYTALTTTVPIRPLLFPFLLQLLHQTAGYHPYNAFVLNAGIMFCFLSGVGICFGRENDRLKGLSAIILCAAHPVIAIYGTGGGYDLLAAAALALALALLYRYLQDRKSPTFNLLWMTLVLLANIRHESIVYLALIACVLLWEMGWHGLKQHATMLLATPVLLLPFIWQRLLVQGRYENPEGVALFSLDALGEHLRQMVAHLFNLDFMLPYNGLLNAAAVIILVVVTVQLIRRKISLRSETAKLLGVVLACLAVNLVVVLAHHAGQYGHPSQARFFIPFSIATALAPILFIRLMPGRLRRTTLLGFALMVFFIYHPLAMGNGFISSLMENRSHEASRAFLSGLEAENPLVIAKWPVQFTSLGYSAVNFDYANQHGDRMLSDLDHRFFDCVIVLQQKSFADHQPLPGQHLAWPTDRKLIARHSIFYNKIYLEISKISVPE